MTTSATYETALKTLQANLTPRYQQLDKFEAYVEGRQYDGRPPWLTEDEVPILDRAPHIVEPVAESAIESFQELLLGDGRFPELTSNVEEDDASFDARFGLSEEQSEQLDKIVKAISDQVGLPQKARLLLGKAMGCRSSVAICCVRDGKLEVDIEAAKSATVTMHHERRREVLRLEIQYPYLERFWNDAEHAWAYRCLLYRRVVDAVTDTTFRPLIAAANGEDPAPGAWQPERVIAHAFGFCPVVWYPFMRDESTRTDPDGVALHERLLDEIDALNRTLSQRDRAALYCGDPQIIESGVDADHNPAPTGSAGEGMRPYLDGAGKHAESPDLRAQHAKWRTTGGVARKGRKKGPGVAWRYPNPESKVSYLLLPPDALKAIDDEANALRAIIADAMSWVRSDPASINAGSGRSVSFTGISGKALAWLYKRQTTRCDAIRPDFADGALLPLVNLLLRIALSYARDTQRGELYLPGLARLPALLTKFEQKIATGGILPDGSETMETRWFAPAIRAKWPTAYFQPTEEDQERTSGQARDDLDAGLITKRTAVERIAPFYGIRDVDEYLKTLEKEAAERMATAHERGMANDDEPSHAGGPAGARKDPPAAPRVGSGAPAAPPS